LPGRPCGPFNRPLVHATALDAAGIHSLHEGDKSASWSRTTARAAASRPDRSRKT